MCILLGCDYLDPIPKIGPNTAYNLIKEHKSLDNVVKFIENDPKKKFTIPDDWPYQDARALFFQPDVAQADDPMCDFKWEAPDLDGLIKFLVEEKGFSEDRVRSGAARLNKNLKSAQQSRIEGFFTVKPKSEEEVQKLKRKAEEKLAEQKKKAKLDKKEKKDIKSKPKGIR
jgi:flap endonuclease-1